jgi:hypothetical protein
VGVEVNFKEKFLKLLAQLNNETSIMLWEILHSFQEQKKIEPKKSSSTEKISPRVSPVHSPNHSPRGSKNKKEKNSSPIGSYDEKPEKTSFFKKVPFFFFY